MEMEKEQKKLLLVAVSVGVFLLVTITAAIVILTTKAPAEETASPSSSPYSAGSVPPAPVNIRNIEMLPPVAAQETDIIAYPETSSSVTDKNDGDRLTINIPKPSAAAVPDTPEIPTIVSKPAPAPAKPAATPVKPAVETKPAAVPVKPAASKPATQAAKPAAPAKTSNDYWVQTGAFTAKIRAEDVKDELASKGITSIIENRQIDGKTWYRVRLGPYTSEKEANYWLALVKAIDGFGESQVRQSVRQQ